MHILSLFFYGVLLGLGAAMPVGPVNLEIIRRNLSFGLRAGVFLGMGAACTDLTYIVILSIGAIAVIMHPHILNAIAVIGALILVWFAYGAFKMAAQHNNQQQEIYRQRDKHPIRHLVDGYLMTLINPMTIIFWTSVSSQVALLAHQSHHFIITAVGVIVGAFGWALSLNTVLHITRHKISERKLMWINIIGGIILLGFAVFGLAHAILRYYLV